MTLQLSPLVLAVMALAVVLYIGLPVGAIWYRLSQTGRKNQKDGPDGGQAGGGAAD